MQGSSNSQTDVLTSEVGAITVMVISLWVCAVFCVCCDLLGKPLHAHVVIVKLQSHN